MAECTYMFFKRVKSAFDTEIVRLDIDQDASDRAASPSWQ